ncbi:hypothetical protein ABZ990_12625 [Streptomyces sp. NPDC046203]|uniref:DUF7507 domain-containing protein n=1 Tax=Streptomyces sp. NPDC046203 TaxID=3154602 RepID=UPI0033EC3F7D
MRKRRPPSAPGRPTPPGRASRFAALALALVVGAGAPLALSGTAGAEPKPQPKPRAGAEPKPQPKPRAGGSPLLNETFTGTEAPEFTGVGPACLTGAPTAGAPPSSGHPLGGCMVTAVGPVPPNNAAPDGFLRLTDASHFQSAAVLYNHAIPAGHGLDVSFDQYQYGSTTPVRPADGISFFLVDGAASLTHPGAFGGSLGYAQLREGNNPSLPMQPGVDHGYLGVGLDVYGNYFGDGEARGNGCAQRSPTFEAWPPPAPNMITLRGPGNGGIGYCFMTATTNNTTTTPPWPSTLPGELQGPTTEIPAGSTPAEAAAILEADRRRINVHITAGANPQLTVSVDFNDGNGPQQVLSTPAPLPLPLTYKFGFASSTGANTDVHLIRNVVVTSAEELPELNLVKQARLPLPGDLGVGSQVPYDFVVTNSGTTPINDLVVTDPKVSPVVCPTTDLAVGQTITCSGTYTVTAADVAAGAILNTAIASGTSDGEPVESPPSSERVPLQRPPGIEIEKNVETPGPYSVGQTVTYRYTVRNTGGTELTGVTVHDDKVTGITCESTTLAPAEEPGDSTSCTGTYVITSADGTEGSVTNTATATGSSDGTTITSPETEVTLPIGQPHITIAKSVTSTGPYQLGSRVDYSYTVTNTGTTNLTNVQVLDDHVTSVTCAATTLAPGASTTCTGSYTITQADIDQCRESGEPDCVITNVAQAGGADPQGEEIVSDPDQASVGISLPEPHITVDKRVTSTGPYQVGSEVTYGYTVTNTGNVQLTNVQVSDDKAASITCEATTLAPGASTECTGTHTITQADADACGTTRPCMLTNVARANGTDPSGDPVVSEPDQASVEILIGEPHISLNKQVVSEGPFQVGSTVDYMYTVTNTGTAPLHNVRVSDDRVTHVVCDAIDLDPGDSTVCQGTYTITQADIDACKAAGATTSCVITNVARATGTDPRGQDATSDPGEASVTVPIGQGALTVAKRVVSRGPFHVGSVVEYAYTVTNSGTAPLEDVRVSDDLISEVTCEATTLAPGASTTCTGTYTVTEESLDKCADRGKDAKGAKEAKGTKETKGDKGGKGGGHGKECVITNVARATGTDPEGHEITSPPAEAHITVLVKKPCEYGDDYGDCHEYGDTYGDDERKAEPKGESQGKEKSTAGH